MADAQLPLEPPVAAVTPEPAPAPAIAPEPAPVIAAPAPAAVPEAAPQVEAEAPKPHTDTPTLLEGVVEPKVEAKPEAKPGDGKPVEAKREGEKPADVKPDAKPEVKPEIPPEPIKYEFKLPETIKGEPTTMAAVSAAFNEGRVPPEIAQKIVDVGTKALVDYANHLNTEQHRVFAETRANWRKEVMADPELGGAGHQTAMGAIARMREALVPESDRKSFDQFLRITGAGDHPSFLRLMHNAARFFDEPALPPPGAQPAPSNGQRPGRRGLRDIYRQTSESQGR